MKCVTCHYDKTNIIIRMIDY